MLGFNAMLRHVDLISTYLCFSCLVGRIKTRFIWKFLLKHTHTHHYKCKWPIFDEKIETAAHLIEQETDIVAVPGNTI
jgi:hypothetical protein